MSYKFSELKQAIREALISGIRRNGERIFGISQDTASCFCPVDTGFLKRSGATRFLPKGIEIFYTSPYAADVEFGRPGKPITGTQTVKVKAHIRRMPGGRVLVKEHEKKYVNKKVIRFRPKHSKFEYGKPIFRVISEEKGQKGQHFLGRAKDKGLPFMGTDVSFYLKQLERK